MTKHDLVVILIRLIGTVCLLLALSNTRASDSIEKTLVIDSQQDFPIFALGTADNTADGVAADLRQSVAQDTGLLPYGIEHASTFFARQLKKFKLQIYWSPIAAVLLFLIGLILFKRQQERRRVKNQLQESEERFKLAIENTQAGLWDWNIKSGELITSPEWSTMLGYEPGSFTQVSGYETLFHPDDLPEVHRRLQAHFNHSTLFYEIEHRLQHKDGHWIWVLSKGKIVYRDKDDQPIRMIGTNVDITARIMTEEKLRLTQFAVDNASDEVYQADMQGRILYANQQACLNLGYAPDELIGCSIQDFNPDVSEERWGKFWRDLPNQKVMFSEAQHRRKDGSVYPVEVSANYARYGDKDYSIAFIRDISKRKEAENAMRLSKDLAEKSARFKSQFLANMSHEIRTPMNGVIGLTQLALGLDMSPDLRDYLNKILTSAQSLLGILNDILDLSKIEAGRMTIESTAYDLDTVIDTLRNLFEQHALQKGLTFHIKVARNTPRELTGDAMRLQQVLSNLLGNAIKFTESGHVVLKISLVRRLDARAVLKFSVEDTGIGMSESDIKKLFVPFSQADDSITRRFGGTGLGLAISQHLINAMGGVLKVDSSIGQGSLFSFELTLGLAGDRNERHLRHRLTGSLSRHGATQIQIPSNLLGMRILVAEDNEVNQLVAQGLLERSGFVVTVVGNGKEALEQLALREFDAVLMDMQMPVMDGLEAARNIRQQERLAGLPIIALTAGVTQEDREMCYAAGMNDFVGKPVSINELIISLSKWINS